MYFVRLKFNTYLVIFENILPFKDLCNPNPCQHGGKCQQNEEGGYKCACKIGTAGENCQQSKNS